MNQEGFAGLLCGLDLFRKLIDTFWESLYPEVEDEEDLELRAAPLEWIELKIEETLRMVPLVNEGHGWFKYQESRTVGFEDQSHAATTDGASIS